jgi:hypothetical protein
LNHKIKKAPLVIFIIMVCLYLPFIESGFGGILWGLNWKSPMFMDQLSDKLRLLKLILVTLAVALLVIKREKIKDTFNNTTIRNSFIVSGYLVAAVQIILLCLGILFAGVSSSNLDYLHKEKTFIDRPIYVHTADPGAMGKAYHYFYLKCQLPLNRYELKLIKKMGWMYEYGFDVRENNLIVTDKSEKGQTHVFDVTNFTCNVQT